MNHFCVCGHSPSDHSENRWCDGEDDKGHPCTCSIYEKDTDD